MHATYWRNTSPGLRAAMCSPPPLELVHEVGDDVEQVLRHEVQSPGELLGDRGLLQSQLPGEPQQLDLRSHGVDQVAPLARGPARRFELDQPAVDPAVLLEHR